MHGLREQRGVCRDRECREDWPACTLAGTVCRDTAARTPLCAASLLLFLLSGHLSAQRRCCSHAYPDTSLRSVVAALVHAGHPVCASSLLLRACRTPCLRIVVHSRACRTPCLRVVVHPPVPARHPVCAEQALLSMHAGHPVCAEQELSLRACQTPCLRRAVSLTPRACRTPCLRRGHTTTCLPDTLSAQRCYTHVHAGHPVCAEVLLPYVHAGHPVCAEVPLLPCMPDTLSAQRCLSCSFSTFLTKSD